MQNNIEETITGTIEIITYRNSENGFFVCKVKVKGHKGNVAVTGVTPVNLSVGEVMSATGGWQQNAKYGLQFAASQVQIMLPKSIAGIQKYLGSGVIKGIGPTFASHIVKMFGERAIDVLENSPSELTQIKGISIERAHKIAESWANNLKVRELMIFLQGYDITVNFANKIYLNYGDAAINILRENPYAMARDIKGIGFLSADKVAKNLGMESNDSRRIAAGIEHVLVTATSSGSCALPINVLIEKSQELLQVNNNLIESAIFESLKSERLIAMAQNDPRCAVIKDFDNLIDYNPLIFFKPFFFMERNIAMKLNDIATTGAAILKDVDIAQAIQQLNDKYNIELADIQKEAIHKLQNNKVMVITGGPGTGKTTLINSIIKIAKLNQQIVGQIQIKLAAPTGRAAKRIAESSGAYSSTIHRMLEFDPTKGGFKYNENNYLKCDLMVLDEASMIDVQIMNAILKALPRTVTLIIVGDVDQLPSIGPGQVLFDLISSDVIQTVRLQQVFRQAKHSKIITNAHMVNSGKIPYLDNNDKKSDFEFISVNDDLQAISAIKRVMKSHEDIQLLTPMQRGSVGVKALNGILQELFNGSATEFVEYFGVKYSVGDKVMQTENNYNKGVFNGDIGYIEKINKESGEIAINFDGFSVDYEMSELDQISLAYAITIHKSQGSEYHTVIMPILTQHFIMLNKNLIYTGITRAKKRLIIIGQKRAIAMAIKSNKTETRYSMLKSWLFKTFHTHQL